MLSAYVTYCTQCYGFYFIKTHFQSIQGTFQSPFGIYGAMYAGLVFLFGIITIVFFQKNHAALLTLLGMWIFMSIYYFAVAKHNQRFSYEEQRSMFVAHVINFNRKKATRHRKKYRWTVKIVNALSSKSSKYKNTLLKCRTASIAPIQQPRVNLYRTPHFNRVAVLPSRNVECYASVSEESKEPLPLSLLIQSA